MTAKKNKASAGAEAMNKFDSANYTNTNELVSSILEESHNELVKKDKEQQRIVDVVSRDEFKDKNVFEITKQKIADKLNVPLKDVEHIWQSLRGKDKEREQEKPIPPYRIEVEPCSESISPYKLAEELKEILKTHIVFREYEVKDAQAITCVLWVLANWSVDVFKYSPYLMITSPEKGCGKSQLLKLLAKLSRKPLTTGNTSVPAYFRAIEKYHPTIFLDEVDSFLKTDSSLKGLIKCGIERGDATTLRVGIEGKQKGELEEFDTFGFKAFSGIQANSINDAITDRCIVISLKRKLKAETVQRYRDYPSEYWMKLKSKCARMAVDYKGFLLDHKPENHLDNRNADKWEELFSIADLIDYVEVKENRKNPQYGRTARRIAEVLSKEKVTPASTGIELLSNIKELFKEHFVNNEFIETESLLEKLNNNQEWRWQQYNGGKGLNYKALSGRLKPFGIEPQQHPTGTRHRGYNKKDFDDSFIRYLDEDEPKLEL